MAQLSGRGEYAGDLRDTWAPVILPVRGFESPNREQELQLAIDSLGYPQTRQWAASLRVAEALSTGEHKTIVSVAKGAHVQPHEVGERVADIRSLFGDWPVPRLLDQLFGKQFLGFEVKGARPHLELDAAGALVDMLAGKTPDPDASKTLYEALDSAHTPSAAVRRAYELQLRKPVGLPSLARRIGFHMLGSGVAVPSTYPDRSQQKGIYKETWGITKEAIKGEMQLSYGWRIPLQPAELAVAALAALGCTNQEIAGRLHLAAGTVQGRFAEIRLKSGAPNTGRRAVVAHLFKTDLFFTSWSRSDI